MQGEGARSPIAADPSKSRGRRIAEPASATRTAFARDRDRIIHTQAFRRLKEKSQVFVAHEGDHFRTRLTHSLEVAQIARALAVALRLDADLTEALALAHDLGHPPFAHAGEEELQRRMEGLGGFDHNVQTFRIVTELEVRYPAFAGLNLTWETLEGMVKHNGPAAHRVGEPAFAPVAELDAAFPLELSRWPSAEAQVAALADDIAYNNHDVEDGVSAGLFTLAELEEVPLVGEAVTSARADWPGIDERLIRIEAVRRLIGAMVADVVAETRRRSAGLASAEEVRALAAPVAAFSSGMAERLAGLRAFLTERMYRHWRVNRTRSQARRLLGEMFELFLAEPEVLPDEWSERAKEGGERERARVACDYIAGMTDRFAIEEHRRLFTLDAWT